MGDTADDSGGLCINIGPLRGVFDVPQARGSPPGFRISPETHGLPASNRPAARSMIIIPISESRSAMNYSIAAVDRATHLKIVAVPLVWASAIIAVAIMMC
jgi:hypothetical protein